MKPTPCIDAETLAVFVDGGLGEAERMRTQEHLAACEDCYEVFSETVKFLRAPAPMAASPRPVVVRPAPARWLRVVLPMAAAAGVAAILLNPFWRESPQPARPKAGPGVPSHRPRPAVEAAPVLPALLESGRGGGTLARWAWSEEPGAHAFAPFASPERTSLLFGVHRLDLELALNEADAEAAAAAGRILRLLEPAPAARVLAQHHRALSADIRSGRPLRDLVERSRSPAAVLREAGLDPELVELGEWLEAARVAALARRVGFLELDETQRRLAGEQRASLPTAAARQFDEVGRLLRTRDWSATGLRRLEHALTELVRRM